jgi:hypothetical protein
MVPSKTAQRAKRASAPLTRGAGGLRARRWDLRHLVALAGAVLVVAVGVWTLVPSGDSDSPGLTAPDCGWDLTQTAGVEANSQFLTETGQWLANRDQSSREMPPAPTSPYWHGQCPVVPGAPPPPPVGEGQR